MQRVKTPMALLILAAILPLGGCGTEPGRQTEPVLASEQTCLSSSNFQRCQFEHYLAGGYPIRSDRGPGR